jgi:hypothetical protein
MYAGEKSLRVLVDKWLGPGGAMTVRVMEFSRTRSDRRRYVRVGTFWREECFAIVFFRHDDGSWNVFPPGTDMPAMRACRLVSDRIGEKSPGPWLYRKKR